VEKCFGFFGKQNSKVVTTFHPFSTSFALDRGPCTGLSGAIRQPVCMEGIKEDSVYSPIIFCCHRGSWSSMDGTACKALPNRRPGPVRQPQTPHGPRCGLPCVSREKKTGRAARARAAGHKIHVKLGYVKCWWLLLLARRRCWRRRLEWTTVRDRERSICTCSPALSKSIHYTHAMTRESQPPTGKAPLGVAARD
jgi:hypothetical protein